MPAPFSNDLRWRMIFHRVFFQRTYNQIASQLFVSSKTVYRTYQTFVNTGDVKPWTLGCPKGTNAFFAQEEYIIMDFVLRLPQMQLNELANCIVTATGSAYSEETLCKAVYRLGITRKKIKRISLLRQENLRIQFMAEVTTSSPHHLVFLDETGIDKRISPPVVKDHSYSRWGPHHTVIAAISCEGIVANYILPTEQRFTEEAFIEFLDQSLLPLMNVYNGVNTHAVVVMDNHAVHHVRGVIDRIYFAKVKHYLRLNDVVLKSLADHTPLIWEAFGQITQHDCQGYMHHAGYL